MASILPSLEVWELPADPRMGRQFTSLSQPANHRLVCFPLSWLLTSWGRGVSSWLRGWAQETDNPASGWGIGAPLDLAPPQKPHPVLLHHLRLVSPRKPL